MRRIRFLYIQALLLVIISAEIVCADQVITEPLVVTGSGCVGNDCVNNENLDDTTLRLKENNLRIFFDDTSVDGSDWWITANDSGNGGQNYFGFSDQDVNETVVVDYTFDEYVALRGDGFWQLDDGSFVLLSGGSVTECRNSSFQVTSCPAGTAIVASVSTVISHAEEQDLWIDPSSNSFQIKDTAVVFGTDTAPRRLTHVTDGVAASDVATVGQLTVAQDTLDAVVALGDDAVAGAETLSTRLDEVASTIAPQQARLEVVETQLATITTDVETVESAVADQQIRLDQTETDVAALQTAVDQVSLDVAENGAAQALLAEEVEAVSAQVSSNSDQLTAIARTIGSIAATAGEESEELPGTEGEGSTALGDGSYARTRDTAIGYRSTVTGDGSVAIGADSLVESANSVAVGADSHVASGAEGGVALGQAAQVVSGATGAVAVGQQSVASEAQTVSVGSTTNQRRITHVAAAQNDHDAINFSQLMEMSNQFQANLTGLARQIGEVDDRLDESGAMMMAFSALLPNVRSQGATQVSFGVGHYSGANAIAGGVFHYLSDSVFLSAGISSAFKTNTTAVQTGVVVSW